MALWRLCNAPTSHLAVPVGCSTKSRALAARTKGDEFIISEGPFAPNPRQERRWRLVARWVPRNPGP